MNNDNEKFCVKCGKKIPKETKFCQYCGAEQPTSTSTSSDSQQVVHNQESSAKQGNNTTASTLLLVFGWISAVLSLLFIPVVFGIIGIVLGFFERKYHKNAGNILIIVSIVLMIVGIVFGMIMGSQAFEGQDDN